MEALLNKLGIDEFFTRDYSKQRIFNKIKDNIPLERGYNYMADLLFLPKTKDGFQYCLVVVDLATDQFDIEPIKTKDAKAVLEAFKTMLKRKYIVKPKVSLTTDSGTEFKASFDKYLVQQHIDHRVGLPNRHKQLANVESLNKQLGRLFNGYMNMKELQTKTIYNEWTDILTTIRTDLNKIRKKETISPFDAKPPKFDLKANPKFKVGDIVHYKLDWAENALGHKQPTPNFRMGDYKYSPIPKRIMNVLLFPKYPTFRYVLEGMPNVSYSEYELLPARAGETETKYSIKQIIGKKKERGIIYYLVWWRGYLKKESTWEIEKNLIEDGAKGLLDTYNATYTSK